LSDRLRDLVDVHSTLNGTAKSLLAQIAHFADDDGKGAYPAVPTLAKRMGKNVRTVQRAIDLARLSGELRIFYNAGPNGVNLYEIAKEQIGAGLGGRADVKARDVTGDKLPDKGSALRRQHSSYRLSASASDRLEIRDPLPPGPTQPKAAAPSEDHRARAEKNNYRTCLTWRGSRTRFGSEFE